jgi:hypothetical protein
MNLGEEKWESFKLCFFEVYISFDMVSKWYSVLLGIHRECEENGNHSLHPYIWNEGIFISLRSVLNNRKMAKN